MYMVAVWHGLKSWMNSVVMWPLWFSIFFFYFGNGCHPVRTCLTSACRCLNWTHCSKCLLCWSAAKSSSCCFSWRNSSRSWTRVAMSTSLSHSSSTPAKTKRYVCHWSSSQKSRWIMHGFWVFKQTRSFLWRSITDVALKKWLMTDNSQKHKSSQI